MLLLKVENTAKEIGVDFIQRNRKNIKSAKSRFEELINAYFKSIIS